ncbi:starch synthase [Palleronia aestuarii]|uniref:Glycogen synthase n=1 Tax=Palleronia aestuarii TaxID=568105 RepID=A0A2W7NW58_9RHOB|nr:glycogen synthase GlgA [Palleronia aestuarii]PZX17536.1 starch synthase [Palleronia aestuarii]
MMRVLSVASECAPLVKTGGLADVAGALPAALAPLDVDMRVLLPGYPQVVSYLTDHRQIARLDALQGGPAEILSAELAGLRVFVLHAPHLFDRDGGIYLGPDGTDWPDNPQRFAALARAGAEIARGLLPGWAPDLVHCHDWQAGLVPYYLKKSGIDVASILTIHNIAFQGLAAADLMEPLELDPADFTSEGFEYWGHVSFLKAGLVWADGISTVSPTYAHELMLPEFGMGLDGLMRHRADDLHGILNGIDETAWNPAQNDHAISYRTERGKARATTALRRELGLPDNDGTLAVVISRLTEQKGLDLLIEALPDFLDRGGQIALLGTGEARIERAWRDAAATHESVAVRIGYDEILSHKMIAGGQAIIVPSRFEPCGLTQLYGLRYGTIPVVAHTGGLADTVIDANDAALKTGVATGLSFMPGSRDSLAHALRRLVVLRGNRDTWSRMVRNAMRHPVGWGESAEQYLDLYRSVVRPL